MKNLNIRMDKKTENRISYLVETEESPNMTQAVRDSVKYYAKQCGYND